MFYLSFHDSIIHTFQPLFNDGFPTYYALLYPKISISPSFMDFFAKKKNHISMAMSLRKEEIMIKKGIFLLNRF
jgi:hypothetical protein